MSGIRQGDSVGSSDGEMVVRVIDHELLRRREQTLSIIERPWNVLYGCRPIYDVCTRCFAHDRLRQFHESAGRKLDPEQKYQVQVLRDSLNEPAAWTSPQSVVIAPYSDLFNPEVPSSFVYDVIDVVARHPQHFFQLTTRRPHRMRYLLQHLDLPDNLSVGIAAEDAVAYKQTIPYLFEVKLRWRHLVLEPLLERIDIERVELPSGDVLWPLEGTVQQFAGSEESGSPGCASNDTLLRRHGKLNWIILGGERGRQPRPPHPNWVRAVRDACARNRTPFFFRGWGDCVPTRRPDMQDPNLVIVSSNGVRRGRGAGSAINQVSIEEDDVYFTHLPFGDEPIQFYLDGQLHRAAPDFDARFPKVRLTDISPLARELQRLASGGTPEGPTTAEFIGLDSKTDTGN